jgi:ribosomal protein L32
MALAGSGERPSSGRSTEEQQVQIQLAGAVAESILPAEGALDRLEGQEQGDRPGVWARTGGHVQRGDRVVEIGLVRHLKWSGHVEARDAGEARSRKRRQGVDGRGQRRLPVAYVGPQADVCPNCGHLLHLEARCGLSHRG